MRTETPCVSGDPDVLTTDCSLLLEQPHAQDEGAEAMPHAVQPKPPEAQNTTISATLGVPCDWPGPRPVPVPGDETACMSLPQEIVISTDTTRYSFFLLRNGARCGEEPHTEPRTARAGACNPLPPMHFAVVPLLRKQETHGQERAPHQSRRTPEYLLHRGATVRTLHRVLVPQRTSLLQVHA